MRKQLTLILVLASAIRVLSQTTTSTPNDFDKKYRFGLRISAQPTWFSTTDKKTGTSGSVFGWGFGLNMEYKFSEVACLLTGIGGDFEGGKYTIKNDPSNNYQVAYFTDENDEFIAPSNGKSNALRKAGNKVYLLKARTVKTTHVTIPLVLKLSTREYNNLKYFGLFGGEIGFRVKAIATDSYSEGRKYTNDTLYTTIPISEQSGMDISKDASGFPARVGLHVGAGVEYRIAPTTSFFGSISYFKSFTNFAKNKSEYLFYNWNEIDKANNNASVSYSFIKQQLIFNAIKINVGIMF